MTAVTHLTIQQKKMFVFLLSLLVLALGSYFFWMEIQRNNLEKKTKPTIVTPNKESTTVKISNAVAEGKEEFHKVFKNVSSVFLKNLTSQVGSMKSVLLSKSPKSGKSASAFELVEEEQTLTEVHFDEEGHGQDSVSTPMEEEEDEDIQEEPLLKKEDLSLINEEEQKRSKMNEKRKNILSEILSTEEYYVKGLLVLDFVYKRQLEEKKILDAKTVKTIFQDIEILINVNQAFLEALRLIYEKEKNQERDQPNAFVFSVKKATQGFTQQQQDNFSSLGELLNKYAHSFKLYSNYISGYKKASTCLNEEKKKNKKLSNFLEATKLNLRDQGERITQLDGYLVTPVQRIRKYHLVSHNQ